METVTEIVYNGRDNQNELELRADGAPVDLSSVDRVRVELEPIHAPGGARLFVDSSIDPAVFDFVTKAANGVLILKLGQLGAPLAAGEYDARLVVYDPTNTQGIVWTHEKTSGCDGTRLRFRVIDAADAAA